MTGRLQDKCALVVGAGSIGPGWGNGKATAALFAREGAAVACADRDRAAAEETAEIIREAGGTAVAIEADVTRSADVAAMVRTTVAELGGLDVLDYNVGLVHVAGVVELEEADWDRILDVNLKGCYRAMKHAIPAMLERGGGSIVTISSVAALRYIGVPYATYYASKAGLTHLTRTTALEYADRGVRANTVLPGLMKTPMVEQSAGLADEYSDGDVEAMWRKRDSQVPMGHMGDAWDVANACLFLASEESRYITGAEIVVDGGFTLKAG